MEYVFGAAGGAVIAAIITYFVVRGNAAKIQSEADARVKAAEGKAEALNREGELRIKDELFKRKASLEKEMEGQREALKTQEARLEKREDNLDRKLAMIDKKERFLETQEQKAAQKVDEAAKKFEEAEKVLDAQNKELRRVSGLSPEEARTAVLERVTKELDQEIGELAELRLRRAKEEADATGRKLLVETMQRCAAEVAANNLVATVDLSSDDMKGRIIGREGRNIRAFEKATGVDVIVDDTPGVVVVSAFDSVRRETAKLALAKLVQDGRIHPARIEEVVAETEKEMARLIDEAGRQAALDQGLADIPPKLLTVLGRLRFRTSYGQNVLQHSVEVAALCGLLAGELKLDVRLAKRVGLLHDLGKALDQDSEGTHPALGADLAAKAGEHEVVVNAIASHHEDVPPGSLYAILAQIADAISAARPGARRESLERYIKRMERLEEIANTHNGVEKAFAIQAGRELRVLAKADKMTEAECSRVCREIAKEIEEELNYPGEVKVTMIRENRFVEYAR
ncbi:MAG TPA: ribonuclease Y [Planctomycetota bacterium]|nr:ribonuclease Y [Planctomycetota bacterium]